jgi:hypothetical protein
MRAHSHQSVHFASRVREGGPSLEQRNWGSLLRTVVHRLVELAQIHGHNAELRAHSKNDRAHRHRALQ